MASSEVGHNKNVANFKSLYQILEEMGALYNPANPAIKLANLQPLKAVLDEAIEEFNEKHPLYKNAAAERETAMAPLNRLTTRIINSFRASNVTASDIENAESMARVIRGFMKPKKANVENDSTESISTSRMSYDNRTANFESMISYLGTHGGYSPNEEDISILQLRDLCLLLKGLNEKVNKTTNELVTARTARNNALYKEETGVVNLVPIVKKYLLSLGDSGKPYYKLAVRLKFTNSK